MKLDNISLKNKMLGMGIFVLISLGILFIQGQVAESNRLALEDIVATNYNQRLDLLMLRRNEKDFLLRLDPKYIDRFKGNYDKFVAQNEHLIEVLEDQDIDSTGAQQIKTTIQTYANNFYALGEAFNERGLDKDTGAYGSLRRATHAVEERLYAANNDAALVKLLTIRRHEKDFMLRLDEKYIGRLQDTVAELKSMVSSDRESVRLLDQYLAEFNRYVALTEQIGYRQDVGIRGDVRSASHETEKLLASMSEKYQQEVVDHIASNRITNIIMTLIFSGFIMAVIFFIGRQLLSAVSRLSESFELIRKSDDLTMRIDITSSDELGRAASDFNTLFEYFHEMVKKIYIAVEKLESATSVVSSSVNSTQQIISDQTSKNEHVSSSVTEMGIAAQSIARNVELTSESVNSTNSNAQLGVRRVNDAIAKVNNLADALVNTGDNMDRLKEKSDGITSVLDVIKGIAEQTNLLALNAAIEAARAGEQGRGFAVVADEVRTLAMRTQESTSQIGTIISELQDSTTVIADAVNHCRDEGLESAERAKEAGEVLHQIMEDMDAITGMAQEIATAVDEQSHVVEEINSNVLEIKSLSNSVNDQSESNTKAVDDVSQQAKILYETISIFKV